MPFTVVWINIMVVPLQIYKSSPQVCMPLSANVGILIHLFLLVTRVKLLTVVRLKFIPHI